MTAPEFSAPASWHAFRDQYEQDYGGQAHPIRTQWFADMVRRCTAADLDALTKEAHAYSVPLNLHQAVTLLAEGFAIMAANPATGGGATVADLGAAEQRIASLETRAEAIEKVITASGIGTSA